MPTSCPHSDSLTSWLMLKNFMWAPHSWNCFIEPVHFSQSYLNNDLSCLKNNKHQWSSNAGAVSVCCLHRSCRECEFSAVEQPVEAFTNILFSSGTTGIWKNKHHKAFLSEFIYMENWYLLLEHKIVNLQFVIVVSTVICLKCTGVLSFFPKLLTSVVLYY